AVCEGRRRDDGEPWREDGSEAEWSVSYGQWELIEGPADAGSEQSDGTVIAADGPSIEDVVGKIDDGEDPRAAYVKTAVEMGIAGSREEAGRLYEISRSIKTWGSIDDETAKRIGEELAGVNYTR